MLPIILDSFVGVKSAEVQILKSMASATAPGTKVKATKLDSTNDRKFRIIVECKPSDLSSISNVKTSGVRVNWKEYVTRLVSRPGVIITVLQRGDDVHPCIATITGPESAFEGVKTDLKVSSVVKIVSTSFESKGASETYAVTIQFSPEITKFQLEEFKSRVISRFGWLRSYVNINNAARTISIPS